MARERKESYRNTRAKDGTYSARLNKTTAARVKRYCEMTGKQANTFVAQCVDERLDVLEDEFYKSLSKEQLIELIKNK